MSSVEGAPRFSIVIPNYNGARYLETCLRSIARQQYRDYEVLVVDNGSRDGSVEVVRRAAPAARIFARRDNTGFAAGVNEGIRASRGEWVAVLNNDTEVAPDWLSECAAALARHPDAAFFACRILDCSTPRRLYSAGDCFLRGGIGYRRGQEQPDREEYRRETEVFSPCGCAAIYRRSVLEELGGYDERFFAYLEDVDLGLRFQAAGCRGFFVPRGEVYHVGGATSGGEFSSLAVRLRTRNSLFLLLKSFPPSVLLRWGPMIAAVQLSWLARALAHGKGVSWLRGVGGAAAAAPALLGENRRRRPCGDVRDRLEGAIRRSEEMARRDVSAASHAPSLLLKWYFRLF